MRVGAISNRNLASPPQWLHCRSPTIAGMSPASTILVGHETRLTTILEGISCASSHACCDLGVETEEGAFVIVHPLCRLHYPRT
jgi:hypothetical protein